MNQRDGNGSAQPTSLLWGWFRRLLAKFDGWVTIPEALSASQANLEVEATRHCLVPRII